jgi:hypothetical protein
MFYGLGPPIFSDSELTSEAMNAFKYFDRTHYMWDRPVTKPVPPQDSI